MGTGTKGLKLAAMQFTLYSLLTDVIPVIEYNLIQRTRFFLYEMFFVTDLKGHNGLLSLNRKV